MVDSKKTGNTGSKGGISPKQPSLKRRRDWYPYYAGFTEQFVNSVIENYMENVDCILDPWSGTGTTSVASFKHGKSSVGIDINPSLTIIGRARFTPTSKLGQIDQLANRIVDLARNLKPTPHEDNDILEIWLVPEAALRIRAIQKAIHLEVTNSDEILRQRIDVIQVSNELPDLGCFFYCALFSVMRDITERFRTTNPMWLKEPSLKVSRARPSWEKLNRGFLEQVCSLRDRLSVRFDKKGKAKYTLRTGSATALSSDSGHFDGAITSPPYATRIDYVKGTLPELTVLGVDRLYLSELRRNTTGTPVVHQIRQRSTNKLISDCGNKLLENVSTHPSKGSSNYYFPWLLNYFLQLQKGISELSRVVKISGTICIVVQDSYYKEYKIDLQSIVKEIMSSHGRSLMERHDFPVRSARSEAKACFEGLPNKTIHESLLVFK